MTTLRESLGQRFHTAGQSHVFAGFDELSADQQTAFLAQLQTVPLDELQQLFASSQHKSADAVLPKLEPIPIVSESEFSEDDRSIGEAALRAGKLAVLLVAGGQGSRLGWEHPKGTYPVGPVSQASLFQIHAEKVLALRRSYSAAVPFLVMTSAATHAATVGHFTEQAFFGLDPATVHFFQQGMMPAIDISSGQLLLEAPGQLFQSPNGHGGTLTALADTGLLRRLADDGIDQLFYWQVDNPLVKIGEPAFLGRHLRTGSEASTKVVLKQQPGEKVGVLALIDERCGIIEYSDLPTVLAEQRDVAGQLAYRAGNTAIHLFSRSFLERVTTGEHRLAYHMARKKVPYWDTTTQTRIEPKTENALKFELFIFDALPQAKQWLVVSVDRQEEFSPLKNATGADSPDTVRRDLLAQASRWWQSLGRPAPAYPLEISPLVAITGEQLRHAENLPPSIDGPTYIGGPQCITR
ncbi:MAG: UTP--glucose-1-phosphate uridylyltransferase [Gemmataceae bacterium]